MEQITTEEKVNQLLAEINSLKERVEKLENHSSYEGAYLDGVNEYNRAYIMTQMGKKEVK